VQHRAWDRQEAYSVVVHLRWGTAAGGRPPRFCTVYRGDEWCVVTSRSVGACTGGHGDVLRTDSTWELQPHRRRIPAVTHTYDAYDATCLMRVMAKSPDTVTDTLPTADRMPTNTT